MFKASQQIDNRIETSILFFNQKYEGEKKKFYDLKKQINELASKKQNNQQSSKK